MMPDAPETETPGRVGAASGSSARAPLCPATERFIIRALAPQRPSATKRHQARRPQCARARCESAGKGALGSRASIASVM